MYAHVLSLAKDMDLYTSVKDHLLASRAWQKMFKGRVAKAYINAHVRFRSEHIILVMKDMELDIGKFDTEKVEAICVTNTAYVEVLKKRCEQISLLGAKSGVGKYIISYMIERSNYQKKMLYLTAVKSAVNFYIDSGWFAHIFTKNRIQPKTKHGCYMMIYVPITYNSSGYDEYIFYLRLTQIKYIEEKCRTDLSDERRVKYKKKLGEIKQSVGKNREGFMKYLGVCIPKKYR